jgi:prevent-host-death family protein
MATSRATAADVQRNFGRYRDAARRSPVTVTHHGRPSVVIVAAEEYERLRRLDRQALAVEELGDADVSAIRKARIPKSRRYRTSDIES